MPPVIDKTRCVNCGFCYEICPVHIFGKKDGEIVVAHGEECWHCNSCRMDCPHDAIRLRLPLPCMMLYVDAGRKEGSL
ncbi:ferredoxin family protein [Desulfovibrio sp. OttesenSCG-928-C14]|nr:ferredoxin family protein [Desulfovibrio sp. OttesenSCG-928-C14]